jgi:hypothetical protein
VFAHAISAVFGSGIADLKSEFAFEWNKPVKSGSKWHW